jgi:hypothetical protein
MKVIINITKHEFEHIQDCTTFYESCGEVESIMKKLQRTARLIKKKLMREKNGFKQ